MILLLAVASVITLFVALCLLFLLATRKTYPGFGYWTAGVGILGLGYLVSSLREVIPLWGPILLGNVAFPIGMVLHLDGIRRFLGLKPASKAWYGVPVAVLAGLAAFYYRWDLVNVRILIISIPVVAINWTIAGLLLFNTVSSRSTFYRVIGSFFGLAGILILGRAIWLASVPDIGLYWKSPLEFAFFISFIVLHLGENLSLVLLNYERVERDLLETQADLRNTVTSLTEALVRQEQTEESLRESEERYRNFFQTSRDAVFMNTLDGELVDLNDAALEMLGFEPSRRREVLGRNVSEFYASPEEREGRVRVVAEIGFSKEFPADLRKEDDTIIHTLITSVARRDLRGKLVGFQGTIRDVTQSRKAAEALKNQLSLMSSLLEAIPAPVFFQDTNHIYLGCNEAFAGFIGRTKEHIIGKSVFDVAPKELAVIYREHDEILFENPGSQVYESSMARADGSVRNVVFHKATFTDSSGAVAGLVGVILDITDRQKAEDSLRESRDTLEKILNNIPVMVAFADRQGSHQFVNDCWQNTVGWTLEEAKERDVLVDLYPDAEYRKHVLDTIARADSTWGDFETLTRDGRIIHTSWVIVPLPDGSTIGIGLDITDRKIADEEREHLRNQLFQAQKMEAIGTLTGGIAHDFNNLLTVINGFAELIILDKSEDDPICGDLQKILETGRKGAELVQRLLALSKKADSCPEPLDLNHLVEDMIVLLKRTFPKVIEIESSTAKDLRMINADLAQVEQAIVNLCINAKESMLSGGRLTIETRNAFVGDGYCRLHPDARPGSHVVVAISDTGTGMSREVVERMFDPFFTTKGRDFKKGTGLGLSVAKGIVEQHNGWIACESEPGKGSTFKLYFPIIANHQVVAQPRSTAKAAPGSKTILLVDDEEHVLSLGKRILQHAGYSVIPATNGKEALEIYARDSSTIDLVVLDLIMPVMTGRDCLEELLRINSQAKVIVSTGHSLDSGDLPFLQALAQDFVHKPYQVKQLVETVQRVLETSREARVQARRTDTSAQGGPE